MTPTTNEFGQPIGPPLPPGWAPPPPPPREPFIGRFCQIVPLDVSHADALFEEFAALGDSHWTYLYYGPFRNPDEYRTFVASILNSADPLYFTVLIDGRPAGLVSYLRITPASAFIEVGHLNYGPRMRRSPAATEAMYLMMRRAFELGYRRYEWKCDSLNAPSRAAALRLGFAFEGVFRNATVYKGRSRDTAWYAVTDDRWPGVKAAFEAWLSADNFDEHGTQKVRLADLIGGGSVAG